MTTSLIQDAEARQQALELNSFIVEAPAGAGKTELLTQRFLRLLAVVENPEEVMALTFTNKASTEMRDRILGSLERSAAGIVPPEPHKRKTFDLAQDVLKRDAARHWNLLGHPGRLRITTLDALCANLARQMPYLSRFGCQPPVCAEPDIHYATAAQRTLEMVDDGTADADVVAQALSFMDNHAGRLESLLVSMLGRRDQWVHHASRIESGALRPEVEAGFAALIERDLVRVADLLDAALQAEIMPLARFAAANAPGCFDALSNWTVPFDASIDDLPGWQALAEFLLTSSGTIRKTVDKRSGFPAGADNADQKQAMLELLRSLSGLPGLADALSVVPSLPEPQFDRADWATVECFSRLLRLAAGVSTTLGPDSVALKSDRTCLNLDLPFIYSLSLDSHKTTIVLKRPRFIFANGMYWSVLGITWMAVFRRGCVETPGNFGLTSTVQRIPTKLDWSQ